MSASDWEEVKRLAADFQRAQLTLTSQKLSDRNCVEIINKLVERKQLEIYFTTDGKEYVTPQHLLKELNDELFIHGGRLNLVDAAKILMIDLNIIRLKAQEIEKGSKSTHIVNGEIINQDYVQSICEEINDKLNSHGIITISDLTGQYNLPTDFLQSVVEKNLGKTINAVQDKQDNRTYYTTYFIERNTCIAKGALMALTKPTTLASILNTLLLDDKLFFSVIDTLMKNKEIPGSVSGKIGNNSVYVPNIFTKAQSDWVTNFFQQNGYLEFSSVSQLGISDPLSFIKRSFPSTNFVILSSCVVGPILIDQVEGAVEDIIITGSFTNIAHILPSVLEEKDAEVLLQQILKKKTSANLTTFNSSFVFTENYLKSLLKNFKELIEKNAQNFVSSGAYVKEFVLFDKNNRNYIEDDKYDRKDEKKRKGGDNFDDDKYDRKEERRKKASEGKGGGGTQGRETKTKSTKKKYMKGGSNDDYVEEKTVAKVEVIKLVEIQNVLKSIELLQEEDSEELIEEIANYFYPTLTKNALEAAKSFYESTIASSNQDRRKKYSDFQEKLNDLTMKIRYFEKGYKQFTSKDVQQQLAKYLLKSVCTDVANEIFTYVSQDNLNLEGKELTNELRMKIANDLPNNLKQPLLALHNSLNSSTVDDFLNAIDAAVGPGLCDIILKKPDKKKERPHLLNHRQQLIEQLNVAEDPALVLHLATLIIFQGVTQTILHASGRFVSTILTFLQQHISAEQFNELQRYHDLVLKFLTSSEAQEKTNAEKVLQEDLSKIKEIALIFKKGVDKSRQSSE